MVIITCSVYICWLSSLISYSPVDKLRITKKSGNQVVGEGATVRFTVTASGINMRNFRYKWNRRGDQLQSSGRVRGINSAAFSIHNVLLSDRGLYYCNVTNEWENSVWTGDIMLTVKGVCVVCIQ